MIVNINYKTTTDAFLRNGYIKSKGIEIMSGPQDVMLTPITSKGNAASGYIKIPLDSVDEVIESLMAAKEPQSDSVKAVAA